MVDSMKEYIKWIIINLFVFIFKILFAIPLLINKYLYKIHKKKHPFTTTMITKLIDKHPIIYELSILVWNFPIWGHIYSDIKIQENETVLQVGCGTGLFNKTHRNISQIDNLDINLSYLEYGIKKKRFNSFIYKSLYDIKSETQKYDVILFARCFHHLKKQKKALMIASSLLKDCGKIIIFDPVMENEENKETQFVNSLYDGLIYNFYKGSFRTYIESILPNDMVIDSLTFKKNLTVTNYNYKYPHTDALVILKKNK